MKCDFVESTRVIRPKDTLPKKNMLAAWPSSKARKWRRGESSPRPPLLELLARACPSPPKAAAAAAVVVEEEDAKTPTPTKELTVAVAPRWPRLREDEVILGTHKHRLDARHLRGLHSYVLRQLDENGVAVLIGTSLPRVRLSQWARIELEGTCCVTREAHRGRYYWCHKCDKWSLASDALGITADGRWQERCEVCDTFLADQDILAILPEKLKLDQIFIVISKEPNPDAPGVQLGLKH